MSIIPPRASTERSDRSCIAQNAGVRVCGTNQREVRARLAKATENIALRVPACPPPPRGCQLGALVNSPGQDVRSVHTYVRSSLHVLVLDLDPLACHQGVITNPQTLWPPRCSRRVDARIEKASHQIWAFYFLIGRRRRYHILVDKPSFVGCTLWQRQPASPTNILSLSNRVEQAHRDLPPCSKKVTFPHNGNAPPKRQRTRGGPLASHFGIHHHVLPIKAKQT